MVLRAPVPRRGAELCGMAEAIGSALAAFGPLGVGALHDWSGAWDVPLVALLLATPPLLAVGVAAGRARTVQPSRSIVAECATATGRQ
jgi:CP family cyanate transporter-like MFS transporter